MEWRIGLEGDAADVALQLFQAPSGADERAAGAESGHKMRNTAARLLEDLGRGGFVMRLPVRRVVVLVRVEVEVGIFGRDLAHAPDGAVGAFHRVAVYDLRAVGRHDALALTAHVRGHVTPGAIAPRRRSPGGRVADGP